MSNLYIFKIRAVEDVRNVDANSRLVNGSTNTFVYVLLSMFCPTILSSPLFGGHIDNDHFTNFVDVIAQHASQFGGANHKTVIKKVLKAFCEASSRPFVFVVYVPYNPAVNDLLDVWIVFSASLYFQRS